MFSLELEEPVLNLQFLRSPTSPVVSLVGYVAFMVLIAMVGSVAIIAIYFNWPINHDSAWFLVASRKLLNGASLYVDVVDPNPPLSFYLSYPGLFIADWLAISDTNGQYFSVAGLYFVSLLWTGMILRKERLLSINRLVLFEVCIAIAYLLPASDNLSRHEHLLLLFLSPWVIGQMGRRTSSRSILRSAFAFVGICINPVFVLLPLAFLIRDLWIQRSAAALIAPGYLTMLGLGIGYLSFVAIQHPQLFSDILPLTWQLYWVQPAPIWPMVPTLVVLGAVALVVFMPALALKIEGGGAFALVALVAAIAFLVQKSGFRYQLIPFETYIFLGAIWVALSARTPVLFKMSSLAAAAILLFGFAQKGLYNSRPTNHVSYHAQQFGPINSIMVGSADVAAGAPVALRLGVNWASRHPNNWSYVGANDILKGTNCAMNRELCVELRALVAEVRDDYAEDIIEFQPSMIVADKYFATVEGKPIGWMEFMSDDPNFAKVMENYAHVKSTERMDFFLREEE